MGASHPCPRTTSCRRLPASPISWISGRGFVACIFIHSLCLQFCFRSCLLLVVARAMGVTQTPNGGQHEKATNRFATRAHGQLLEPRGHGAEGRRVPVGCQRGDERGAPQRPRRVNETARASAHTSSDEAHLLQQEQPRAPRARRCGPRWPPTRVFDSVRKSLFPGAPHLPPNQTHSTLRVIYRMENSGRGFIVSTK